MAASTSLSMPSIKKEADAPPVALSSGAPPLEIKKEQQIEDLAPKPELEDAKPPPAPGPEFEESDIEAIRAKLLEWYDCNHRVLPWRRNRHSKLPKKEPKKEGGKFDGKSDDEGEDHGAPLDLDLGRFTYGVWVCEVMSQQTQLDRVKKYWRAWMKKWPDVDSLARATEDEVREAWAGLGYYRRAAFLLKGARYVSGELGGSFPRDEAGLQKIPGVGAYTSAAIASIACGVRTAVVDGNVARVVSRLRALRVADPKSAAAAKAYSSLANALIDPARPGDFNQAVMELGATVCVPNTRPSCSKCPVRAHCAARAREISTRGAVSVTDFPAKSEKAARREETVDVCVIEVVPSTSSSDFAPAVLLQKRPEGGLLAGLWEFPSVPVPAASLDVDDDEGDKRRRSAVDEHVSLLLKGIPLPSSSAPSPSPSAPLRLVSRRRCGEIVHVFSHIRMTLSVEHVKVEVDSDDSSSDSLSYLLESIKQGAEVSAEGVPATKWVRAEGMHEEKVSSSVAKCWKLVSEGGGKGGTGAPSSSATSTKRSAPIDPEVARKETGGGIKRFFQVQAKKA